jgi:hypothetical protein
MPNYVQYSTSNLPGSIRKGNVALGVTTASIAGPTSTSNWYTGITPENNYVIYKTAASGDPDIFTPQNDAELFRFVTMQGGGTTTNIASVSASLAWIATQTNLVAVNFDYQNIITDGLIAALDASYVASYPTTGSTIYDFSGQGANGTLNGNVNWVNVGLQSYFDFPTSGLGNYISSTLSQAYLDCTIVIEPDFSLNQGIAGLIATSTPAGNADKSLRFTNVNGTGPWTIPNPGNTDDWANSATTYYVNGVASNTLATGWQVIGGFRTNTSTFPSTFPYFLGSGGYSTNRGFQGKLAIALLYNRQLSAAEQMTNYFALIDRFAQ